MLELPLCHTDDYACKAINGIDKFKILERKNINIKRRKVKEMKRSDGKRLLKCFRVLGLMYTNREWKTKFW